MKPKKKKTNFTPQKNKIFAYFENNCNESVGSSPVLKKTNTQAKKTVIGMPQQSTMYTAKPNQPKPAAPCGTLEEIGEQ